ncbi:MAG: glycosyltransferase family 2 protein [Acidobacteriota bacterium]
MKISVAIATYNRSTMVREAITAALGQSCTPEEIVVADDASTDETSQMLESQFKCDARVRVIRQPRNTGGVANWNAAMDAASGDFIAWCSDDDRFLPDHLKASVDYLEAHPEVGMVHSSFVDVWETPQGTAEAARLLRSARPLLMDRRNLFLHMTRYYDWPFHPSTLVMRREVWEQTGPFDPRYALADTDWFVRASERFRVAMLPRYGVLNRRHAGPAGNWSNRVGSARMQSEIFEIVESALVRRWPRGGLRRIYWRAVWRANVRLRLLLTVRARMRSGHGDAACSAWTTLTRGTGTGALAVLDGPGQWWIRRGARRLEADFVDARQSVSPL